MNGGGDEKSSASSELFYLDEDGKRRDESLQDALLKDGDHAAAVEVGKKFARAAGLTEEQIACLYEKTNSENEKSALSKLRTCLRDPISEIFDAARFLDAAVSAHLRSERRLAEELIRLADMPLIGEWTDSLWGKGGPSSRRASIGDLPPTIPQGERLASRMPQTSVKTQLRQRDGFHCRFCEIPLVRAETRVLIQKAYPSALRWGSKNSEQHFAFQAMWLQYDHIVPHAMGGSNELGNMVVTCAPCNFGRAECYLEQVGVADPRSRDPIHSLWDGLERFEIIPSMNQAST